MQVQFDDIASGEGLLWQIREEEFVDDARARDANLALLLTGRMGRYHHAAGHTLSSHRHLWAVVEAAHQLTFGSLLDLIGGQVQTRLDQRVIEYAVVFAASDKGEPRHIREYGPGAILPVEPQ